jgi:pyruvate,water dikinase
MRIDEEHHFLSGLLLSPSRKLILAGGRCLARQGLIARAEDVFFVSLPELKAALSAPGSQASLRPVVERRRSEWQRARRSVPSFELPAERSEAQGASPAAAGEPNVLQGSPMSPGVVTGRAVVAEHLDQVAGIEPGAILITTSPNPALTPLFPLLGGLVSATGGALSHGFVSAREYALPAVSGINRVTEKIPPGALVRVDGGTGRVEVLQ